MVHSGSRALGPAIRDHHLARAQPVEGRLRALDVESDTGKEYLHDALWARRFAEASRKAMAAEAGKVLTRTLKCGIAWEMMIATDHNHVALERHGERELWVHRKGAMSAQWGQPGVLPGSMGSPSFHVEGRGCKEALCSSAHGAEQVQRP
jgi:tRNA-splicing ligase RtcB (3'-phosphate/5'-hydroxy nucleic acid ligase)